MESLSAPAPARPGSVSLQRVVETESIPLSGITLRALRMTQKGRYYKGTNFKKINFEGQGGTQWQNTCFACMRPRV